MEPTIWEVESGRQVITICQGHSARGQLCGFSLYFLLPLRKLREFFRLRKNHHGTRKMFQGGVLPATPPTKLSNAGIIDPIIRQCLSGNLCINYHHWRDVIYIYIIASQVLLVLSQANKFVAIKEHKLLCYVLNSANGKLCLCREVAGTQGN